MINCSNKQGKYILNQEVPEGTYSIKYNVYESNGEGGLIQIYSGQCRYFGDDFEIEYGDFIENYWKRKGESQPAGNFLIRCFFYDEFDVEISSYTNYCPFDKDEIKGYTVPSTGDCPYLSLHCINSDFKTADSYDVVLPLKVKNSILVGRTKNNIIKTTYMNKYNDIYNGKAENKIELECYVDDEWLRTFTGKDELYMKLMGATQSARRTILEGTARISGLEMIGDTNLRCRVADVEEIETYSSYSGTHRVPSLKITIEIYK